MLLDELSRRGAAVVNVSNCDFSKIVRVHCARPQGGRRVSVAESSVHISGHALATENAASSTTATNNNRLCSVGSHGVHRHR